MAHITFDWVLDGALEAGLRLTDAALRPYPRHADALAGSVRSPAIRRVPEGALVHASVHAYVQAHPEYWRRLPARVVWTDPDWLARGERLLPTAPTDRAAAAPRDGDVAALAS